MKATHALSAKEKMMKKADIGVVGLAVMGENLILNMASKGFTVACFARTTSNVTRFKEGRGQAVNIMGTYSYEELVASLSSPRKIMLMIRAGKPVDDVIETLIPLLNEGDIVIDGGNTNFPDTIRREAYLKKFGIHFVGSGVSGGEEGALHGPSLMPGGTKHAYTHIEPIFKAIAADYEGEKCVTHIGENGAGHFVKMVHNGIEYGDIQLIGEAYHIMRELLQLSHDEMGDIFSRWNERKLDSYLIEITANILKYKDSDGSPLVSKILDQAGQKGTGKWTAITSLEQNVALSLITESVYARIISSKKAERVVASKAFPKRKKAFKGDKDKFLEHLEKALYVTKIISYAQGFDLMKETAKVYDWDLNMGAIAAIWRGGCIIRSVFLNNISAAFNNNKKLVNLMLDPFFKKEIKAAIPSLRIVIAHAVKHGIPTLAFSSALGYFDSYSECNLPANLLQAQRDYFGAHTYKRIDKDPNENFHTNWTSEGGATASTNYDV